MDVTAKLDDGFTWLSAEHSVDFINLQALLFIYYLDMCLTTVFQIPKSVHALCSIIHDQVLTTWYYSRRV